jgi:hypothetical protein
MTWICPQDGTTVEAGRTTCTLCGYSRIPAGVSLRSEATGREVQVRIPTTLGARALARLEDPEQAKISPQQFRLERRPDQGGWVILPEPFAVNAVWVNGAPLAPEGVLFHEGDTLSIAERFFRLTVHLLH